MSSLKQAYIVRCNPEKNNHLDKLPDKGHVFVGWSLTQNELLLNSLDRDGFKEILKNHYEYYRTNAYALGQATGYLWRFIKEMKKGDYVLVPVSKAFFLGEVKSDADYHADKDSEDATIRREVRWLNDGKPIPRENCKSGLISRLKYQGTCVNVTDLKDQVDAALEAYMKNIKPTFSREMRSVLKEELRELLTSNKANISPVGFEKLVRKLMLALGATQTEIPAKNRYPGSKADVDIIADFTHLGLQIYLQVKKHKGESDESAMIQIIEALNLDNPDGSKPIMGWAVTSGTFSGKAVSLANANGIRVINGDELAEMILSVGLDHF